MSDEAESEPSPALSVLGQASGLGWLAAAIFAVPAAWRGVAQGASFPDAWLIAATMASSVMLPTAWLVSRAARGFRGVVGPTAGRELLAGLVLWASFSAIGLSLLGSILHAKTHHRGLGGAAFGVVGLVLLLGTAVAAGRLVAVGRGLRERGFPASGLAFAVGCVGIATAAWSMIPLARHSAGGASLAAAATDALLAVVVTSVVLTRRLPEGLMRALGVVGLPLAVFTVVAGSVRIETSASAGALSRGGGLAGAALGTLEGWSDRDGDGFGAHFGGKDCDEGDPRRHPGAPEISADGIDSDCDGKDPFAPERPSEAVAVPSASASSSAAASAGASSTPNAAPSAAPSAAVLAVQAPGERPDIIVVTLDTVRADRTSLHGYAKKTTPNLEKLAEFGAVFDHAYAVAADTQRAITPIVSGRPLSETAHAPGEWPVLDDKPDMVAERLSRAGYRTGAVTSFTWLRRDRGFAQGFETFDESAFRENHPERKMTGARAIDAAIAAHAELVAGDKPVYLWVHLFDAHSKYLAHPESSFGTGEANLYLGELAYVDRELARLIDAVSKSARGNRTVWLVHGSHGEAFGEHASTGHGTQLFDEVLHVPFLIAGANVKRQHVETAVSVFDVAATVVALGGADSQGLTGVSLVPALRGESLVRAPFVAHAYRRVAVIDWPLKLTGFRQKAGGKLSLTLFDLAEDPTEKRDLAKSRAADAKRLDVLRKLSEEQSSDIATRELERR